MTLKPVTLTLYTRIDDSPVINQITTYDTDLEAVDITDENRLLNDAPDATVRYINVDMPAILRGIADEIEARR